jgi:hypothetical protein
MIYKIAADIAVAIHLGWILFLIFGALIGRYRPWVKWLHIGGLAFSLALQIFSFYCPLTYLEVWLRSQHDPALAYTGSFIAHQAERLVYLELSRSAVLAGTVVLVLFSGGWYLKR